MLSWLSDAHLTGVIGIWLSAIVTLGLFSLLYRENPVYRMFEHMYIGAAAGYLVYTTWSQTLKPLWWDRITQGQWYWVLALVAGSMFYFIYIPKHVWISRIVFGMLLGLVSGLAFKSFAEINIDRIHASFKPVCGSGIGIGQAFNNLLFIAILLAVMAYFFFSFEHKNTLRRATAGLGRWFLMFAFGAMFGATVMARLSLLIGRVYFLLSDWLHITH